MIVTLPGDKLFPPGELTFTLLGPSGPNTELYSITNVSPPILPSGCDTWSSSRITVNDSVVSGRTFCVRTRDQQDRFKGSQDTVIFDFHRQPLADTLNVELRLSLYSVQPVLARCFNAVAQTAYDAIPRSLRLPKQEPCDPAGPRKRDVRTDVVSLSARAYFVPSGRPVDSGTLTLTAVPQPNGGGHEHGARPAGTFVQVGEDVSVDGYPGGSAGSMTLTLSEAGEAQAIYRTSGVSGWERIRAVVANGGQVATETASVAVRVKGLQETTGGSSMAFIGVTSRHPDSHWGAGGMGLALQELADSLASIARFIESLPEPFRKRYGRFPSVLAVNDMSLPWGGLFDINAEWVNPHMEHRNGLDADVDVRRGAQDDAYARSVLRLWVDRMGHTVYDERQTGNHYHLNF
jgi:hypothetical protein